MSNYNNNNNSNAQRAWDQVNRNADNRVQNNKPRDRNGNPNPNADTLERYLGRLEGVYNRETYGAGMRSNEDQRSRDGHMAAMYVDGQRYRAENGLRSYDPSRDRMTQSRTQLFGPNGEPGPVLSSSLSRTGLPAYGQRVQNNPAYGNVFRRT